LIVISGIDMIVEVCVECEGEGAVRAGTLPRAFMFCSLAMGDLAHATNMMIIMARTPTKKMGSVGAVF